MNRCATTNDKQPLQNLKNVTYLPFGARGRLIKCKLARFLAKRKRVAFQPQATKYQ